MGRNIRSTLPLTTESLTPQWPYLTDFRKANDAFKKKQKHDYDHRHRTRDMPNIPDDTNVWITTDGHCVTGKTVAPADTPRSYFIETPSGEVRRNRSQLNVSPSNVNSSNSNDTPTAVETPTPIMTRSKTGTPILPPNRLT